MSEEEKKAIHDLIILKQGLSFLNCIPGVEKDEIDIKAIDIILNLIEKQQKEIEELKDNYIKKDKIKAKIEEIDIEIQCCEYADDDTEEYKQDIEKEKRRLLRDKAVLKELLEEE